VQTTFFEDIAITNRAYCDSLGLPSDVYQRPLSDLEANGVPLSADEIEIADHMTRHGISRKAASMLIAVNNMPSPVAKPRPEFRCIVETVRKQPPVSLWNKQDITPYYDDCRSRSAFGPAWCGD
jgi:hypothetical protein